MIWNKIADMKPRPFQRVIVYHVEDYYGADYLVKSNGEGIFVPLYDNILTNCGWQQDGENHIHNVSLGSFEDQPVLWAEIEPPEMHHKPKDTEWRKIF